MDDETEITLGNIELMREELEMEELEQKWQWELNDWLEDAMFDREEYKHRWDTRHEFLESLEEKTNGK